MSLSGWQDDAVNSDMGDLDTVANHQNRDFQELCMEVGGVTIASSTLDYVLRIFASALRGGDATQVPRKRKALIAQLRDDFGAVTADDPEGAAIVEAWLTKATNLLAQRDQVV